MFRLVRFFLLTSAVAATIVVAAIVLYRASEVRRIIEFAESQNVVLAHAIANTLWPRFSLSIRPAVDMGATSLADRAEVRAIHEALTTLTHGLPVLKVKIYLPDGLTIYSTEPGEIGESRTGNPGLVAVAQGEKWASKLVFRNQISSFSGILENLDVVETYLPLRISDGAIEGVFELYTDVTALVTRITTATLNLAVGSFLVFGMLYGTLLLAVRRADRTIKTQYAAITAANAALRWEIAEREEIEAELKRARDNLETRVAERTRLLRQEAAERKQAEDRALRHRNELAQIGAVITMSEMATSLAHEINQPLTVISGGAQFCLDGLRTGKMETAALVNSLRQVVEQAARAHEIIRRVRGFLRKGNQDKVATDLNRTIQAIADLLRIDAHEYGAVVEFDLAATLPAVLADPLQIQQVVLNLAHNGLEAMSDNERLERRLTIKTTAPRDDEVEVTVRDTGAGMPPEVLDRVFDPFFTTKPGGLGMGLAISRSIIEVHGGRIWAAVDAGGGTAFRFRLPVPRQDESDVT